jgi:hypothetical protein
MLYFLFYSTLTSPGKISMNTNHEKYQDKRKGTVTTDYASAFSDPVKINDGEALLLRRRETVWDGWLWCTTEEGKSGWIPESFVDTAGDTGKANRDYDATELTVLAGDELDILDEESGWAWCRNSLGTFGWVPLDNLKIQESK